MLGVEPGAGVAAGVGDHDRHQGRDGGGLEKNLNYTIYNIAGPKAQNSRDIAISGSFPHLAQSSAFPQSSETLGVIEGNASVSSRGLLHLLSPRNLGVLVKTKYQERRLFNCKHFDKFNLTWYFSPSALLVTGIKIPSMSAYRAGVWLGKRNQLSSGFLGQSGLFHER